ncbi:Ig-like domain (group 2) [Sinosporangium album]|uniref:Ig-like domain (Group 2) n=1 Tax=Sinosporangium album TaxID=504805 RepID=A0A1G8KCH8_9ACTN|nr:Ig-like domain-containing protein [Sinosporangium album]SDI41165.1 Ig-like domain (group 2) [Sinosporangium album]
MLDDDATVVPAIGHFFFNPAKGAAKPANVLAPPAPWIDFGHTALEDPFGLTSEGGETTTLGTWQNKSLRNVTSPRVRAVTFVAQQWDEQSYKLYFGANGAMSGRYFRVPVNPVETTGTLMVVVEDGIEQLGMYFPNVSIAQADDIEFNAEELAGLPLRATILGTSGQNWPFEISPKGDLLAQTLEVTPAAPSVVIGATSQLAATATYPDTATRNVTAAAAWSTSNPAIATVSAAGLVTGVAAGTATITATYATLTDTAAVTVTVS